MEIGHVLICNFRCFDDFEFELGGRSIFLIGENSGGKTALLTAIARDSAEISPSARRTSEIAPEPSKSRLSSGALILRKRVCSGTTEISARRRLLSRSRYARFGIEASEEADVEHHYPRTGLNVPGARSARPSLGTGCQPTEMPSACCSSEWRAT